MTDKGTDGAAPRRRRFRKYYYRGIEVDDLLDLNSFEFMKLVHSRARRKFQRGLKPRQIALVKRLRSEKKKTKGTAEKPKTIKTHLRNMLVVPEMIGSMIGVYNGCKYCLIEVKPDMVGCYFGEFSITYKPVRHGRQGVSGIAQARFIPV